MRKNGLDSTKTLRKNDLILIAICAMVVAILFSFLHMGQEKGKTLLVRIDGSVTESHALGQKMTRTIITDEGENLFEIVDGTVRMQTADCPDQICVNHAAISKAGETIVCLPHKLVLEIVDEAEGEEDSTQIDAITK